MHCRPRLLPSPLFLVILMVTYLVLTTGCTEAQRQRLAEAQQQQQIQNALETETSATIPQAPDQVFAATVSVLSSAGYVLTNTNREAGVVSGTQNAGVDMFAGSMVGASGMVKQASVTIAPSGTGTHINVVINIALLKGRGVVDPLSADSATTRANRAKFWRDLAAALGHPVLN